MRRLKPFILTLFLILLALAVAAPAEADGIIIPDPPICRPGPCPEPFPITQLAIEYHRVSISIQDQVAVTKVDQVFRNDNDWEVEGTYIFPIPPDAAVTAFTLWIDGQPVEGKVLTREEARETYEEIVRKLRDPALLEYIDRGAVQASIYPIPPGGKRRIQLEYTQVLQANEGLLHYVYPLSTEKYSTEPLEEVSVSVSVSSPQPVRAVYSPSHEVAISRESDYEFKVGYEANDVRPNQDFELFYSVDPAQIGLELLTYRDPGMDDSDGFFLLLAAPSVDLNSVETVAKDVIFVLDRSGSMDGEKFRQAQAAIRYVLEHLNPQDRFNLISFSTGTQHYASSLQPRNLAADAKRWVDTLSAQGATDINRALLEAVAQLDTERPGIVIFLTDGQPTEGVTEAEKIIDNLSHAAPSNVRLFAFGVGYDVDTLLLDTLAEDHQGATSYVTPGQAIDEAVSAFYAKVNNPLLVDLELDFGEVVAYDLHPSPLPDIFVGSQLVLVGRYRQPGMTTITLCGKLADEEQSFEYPEMVFRSSGGHDFLPRLWATRKIGSLLSEIRLHGTKQELVDQIVALSIRYGIVTRYTSYLVTEPNVLGAAAQEEVAQRAFEDFLALPSIVSGQAAVERSEAESKIGEAGAPLEPSGEAADYVQTLGSRTYRLVEGVWIDTAFDPETGETTKVAFLSEDYFSLAERSSDLAAAFALGPRVIAFAGEMAIEVIDAEAQGDPISIDEIPMGDPPDADPLALAPIQSNPPSEAGGGPESLCPASPLPLALSLVSLGLWKKRRSSPS